MTPGLFLYRGLTAAAAPFAALALAHRARRGKEPTDLQHHRFARDLPTRPTGQLVWCHGASIGEIRMLAGLIGERDRTYSIIYTVQTHSAYRVLTPELSDKDQVFLAPLDLPRIAKRFLDHWRPDLAVFAESEIWPNLLLGCDTRNIPRILLNARLSPKSNSGWQKWPRTALQLISGFRFVTASAPDQRAGLEALGAHIERAASNLKIPVALQHAPEPSRNDHAISSWKADRKLLLGASTHESEELMLARAMKHLDPTKYCLILAPRHPDRAAHIRQSLEEMGSLVAQRSRAEFPSPSDIYIADTVGEMDLWYELADRVFLGGSHDARLGGHSPLEPAVWGKHVLMGPEMQNYREISNRLQAEGFASEVSSPEDIAKVTAKPRPNPTFDELRMCFSKELEAHTHILQSIDSMLEPPLSERSCK